MLIFMSLLSRDIRSSHCLMNLRDTQDHLKYIYTKNNGYPTYTSVIYEIKCINVVKGGKARSRINFILSL